MQKSNDKVNGFIVYICLHILMLLYSASGIFSKYASKAEFMSMKFICLYLGVIVVLAVYAICWQQILKKLPLSIAYANKSVTVLWGSVWGFLLFNEKINAGKAIGIIMVIAGIILISGEDS